MEEEFELLGIKMPYEEFDRLICLQNNGKKLVVIDNKVEAIDYILTPQELNEIRINELKELLSTSDYKAIKYAEGELTEEEYAPVKAQRRAWRAEINSLEQQNISE